MTESSKIEPFKKGCIDYDIIIQYFLKVRLYEIRSGETVIPLIEDIRINFIKELCSLTECGITRDIQIAMALNAAKIVYSGPHIEKDDILKIEEEKEEEEKKKDIFEGVVFAPSENEDIKNELNTRLVKKLDKELYRQLGIECE